MPSPVVNGFSLAQNYPNPFNPETVIEYYLAFDSEVKIEILNIVCQTVRTLVAGKQPAGNFSIRWDGTDDHNFRLGSGVYFMRMSARAKNEFFRDVKRVVLLK
jgi:flagellar hook assembly protein FlgD